MLGNYQIKQTKSYIQEHLQPSYFDEDYLEFVVELCDKQSNLLRVRFHSRHSITKSHIAIVKHDDNQEQPIQGWLCTLASGSRTVGCCVHITTLLWHMEVKQGETNTKLHPLSTPRFLGFVDDSSSDWENDDDDNSDENTHTNN